MINEQVSNLNSTYIPHGMPKVGIEQSDGLSHIELFLDQHDSQKDDIAHAKGTQTLVEGNLNSRSLLSSICIKWSFNLNMRYVHTFDLRRIVLMIVRRFPKIPTHATDGIP